MRINLLAVRFPLVADTCGDVFGGDGQLDVYELDFFFPYYKSGLIFPGGGFVVVRIDRDFVSKFKFVFFEIFVDVFLNGRAYAV